MLEVTGNKFTDACLTYYIEHGKPCTIAELADFMGVSNGAIERATRYNFSLPDCTRYQTVRTKGRKVHVFVPKLHLMRWLYLKTKGGTDGPECDLATNPGSD